MGRTEIAHFAERDQDTGFSFISGKPILLSAPHATLHYRDGAPKQDEPGTDLMAVGVAKSFGGSAIWVNQSLEGDPNWDHDHPYKAKALDLSRKGIALDLHVMMDRGFDICIGLGDKRPIERNLWSTCAQLFLENGFTVSLNYPFPAGARTVTSYLQRHDVQAIQVEMTWDMCRHDANGRATSQILLQFCQILLDAQT